MSLNYSKTIIAGHVGRDPEWKEVGNGLCSFSVAVSDSWKDKDGEWQTATDWYNITIWGESGKYYVDKIKKGDNVLVIGRQKSREHDGKTYWSLTPEIGGLKIVPRKDAPKAAKVAEDTELPF